MVESPVRPRPNILFNLLGVLLIVAGIGLVIVGLGYAIQVMTGFDPFNGDGPPVEIADGMALAFWGVITLTVGRYFWRGARRRGVRDRVGRLLIIVGYVLLGIALDQGTHSMVGLWDATTEEAGRGAVVDTLITVALWGVPAAIVAAIGFKLANEKALATAEVKASL